VTFSGPRVRIGRSRDNSLILTESDAPSSSARHAEAAREQGAWWITDAGSTNGTFVNGARVGRRRLRVGDRLSFGDDQFIVSGNPGATWGPAAAVLVLVAVVAGVTYATRRPTLPSREQIASAAARSVYAVAVTSGGARSIIGTAFAVDRNLLATNAHVANALENRGLAGSPTTPSGPSALAIRSDTYEVNRITAITLHPEWQPGSMRADTALLRVEGPPLTAVTLAGDREFRTLQRGTSLVSFGFPAVSTDVQRPRGRLSVDVVGDLRGEYLQAGLAIVPGTSGSPVFDDEGAVVAVVAGGDFVKGVGGALVPTGSQVNWAISVERVRELLKR
jgi:V8-like Glu-specific endopeptidase